MIKTESMKLEMIGIFNIYTNKKHFGVCVLKVINQNYKHRSLFEIVFADKSLNIGILFLKIKLQNK